MKQKFVYTRKLQLKIVKVTPFGAFYIYLFFTINVGYCNHFFFLSVLVCQFTSSSHLYHLGDTTWRE